MKRIQQQAEKSRTCKCGHDIYDHKSSDCNHEVGGVCVQNEHGGKCNKCKCKTFNGKLIHEQRYRNSDGGTL